MTVRIADAILQTLCDALVDAIDAGAGSGTLKIYQGTHPADPDAAPGADTLLATLTFAGTAFGAAAIQTTPDRAEATAFAITDETNSTAGTAGYFLIEDSNGANIITGTVTATGGGGDLELSSVTIPSAGTVSITSAKISVTRDP